MDQYFEGSPPQTGRAELKPETQRNLGVWSLGFPRQPKLMRALAQAGWTVRAGWRGHDAVGVWGRDGVARRGLMAARLAGKPVLSIEDGFLRSVHPGPGAPVLSLILDDLGIFYDATAPSRLERLIAAGGGDETQALQAMALLKRLRLSKYNNAPDMTDPPKDHVLVVDQTAGDASIQWGMAGADSFTRMLEAARVENPGAEIIIKSHPETAAGDKAGHFRRRDEFEGVRLIREAVNPWDLIENARAVYTVTSQLGFEALSAGLPVRCFGTPFYAGWGATEDEVTGLERRQERRTAEQIFAAAMFSYPTYFDPWRGEVCSFDQAVDALTLLRDHDRKIGDGVVFVGARRWKRRRMAQFLSGKGRKAWFNDDPANAGLMAVRGKRRAVIWGAKTTTEAETLAASRGALVSRIEDGFIRSAGLGAALTPPVSLTEDDLGLYFDPSRPSRLEELIANAPTDKAALDRAALLRKQVVSLNITKYNLRGVGRFAAPPVGRRAILVPGQVEDDASIIMGAGQVRTNLALLQAVRAAAPDAWVVYKPHPDVEAGLRSGMVAKTEALQWADSFAADTPAHVAMNAVDEVWTMTSLLGFEALLRGKSVTTFGAPFYAGWGLTDDRCETPGRRQARPHLDQLAHAVLIDYPVYWDPVSRLPAPPEIIIERLAENHPALAGPDGFLGLALSRLQGALAGHSWLWRW